MAATLESLLRESYKNRFLTYKKLGNKVLSRLNETQLHWTPNEQSNSVAIIVQHMAGNMRSRFTDFLSSDGEKSWRRRDMEFEDRQYSKDQLTLLWNQGWQCLEDALAQLQDEDLTKTVYIRGEAHTAADALNRQLSHYPYHVGQMICIAKALLGPAWDSLSIPVGQSDAFNAQMRQQQQPE
ncbi:DUF1572 family protein [Compostibacter hankyongensis]|uniref:DUF1572 domain-containing protein n=1 Tax=Compostibacter hankyongensis TaxID=1007089 RepID=A0ABP8G7I9_9BACT